MNELKTNELVLLTWNDIKVRVDRRRENPHVPGVILL